VRQEKERGREGLKDWLAWFSVRKPRVLDGVEHIHDLLPHMVASGICWQDKKKDGAQVEIWRRGRLWSCRLQSGPSSLQSMTASFVASFGLHISTADQRHSGQLQPAQMERNLMQCASSLTKCMTRIPCASAPKPRPATFTARRQTRSLHATRSSLLQSRPPKSRDRGPKSDEDTQTDFSALDVLRNTVAPATSIDACTSDGFALNNQMRISGSGILLVGGEAFRWRPWLQDGRKEGTAAQGGTGEHAMTGKLLNARGQWVVHEGAWGVLELVYPKPGTPYSQETSVDEADSLQQIF